MKLYRRESLTFHWDLGNKVPLPAELSFPKFQGAAAEIPESQFDFKSEDEAAGESGGLGECRWKCSDWEEFY